MLDIALVLLYNIIMTKKTQLVENYILQIIEGNLQTPGFRLPSENTLCRVLGVSRQTCRPAIAELVRQGLVYKVKGSGAFISERAASAFDRKKKAETDFIAVIVPDLSSPFLGGIVGAVQKKAYERGYSTLLFTTGGSTEAELECAERAIAFGVRGFIVYPSDNSRCRETLCKLQSADLPAVFIDGKIYGKRYISVSSNGFIDVENATSQLVHLGHRHIGIIYPDPSRHTVMEDRLAGYRNCLKSMGVPFHKAYALKVDEGEDAEAQVRAFLAANRKLTSVIVLNSALTLVALDAMRAAKKKNPKLLSMAGYEDDFSDAIPFMEVKPTTIKQNVGLIGETAVANLFRFISNFPGNGLSKILVQSGYTIRDTTKSAYFYRR